ncbi:MAG: menaquinol oxidoreductase [candidate division Zixibacteria bacterium]|nr:menaquinol oxidoreductase [candidate division Zixibacteria bacterium]
MRALYSLLAYAFLVLLVLLGVGVAGLDYLFGVIIPYAAIAIFLAGFVYRILKWAKSPVPFRIPTTCGQQKSLDWIKSSKLESPHSSLGVIGRMALEVLFFRSLFRNTKTSLKDGPKLVYGPTKWLWIGSLAFHWSFLIILIRHLRFFTEPVPYVITLAEHLDGFFQVGLPIVLLTDLIIVAALTFLVLRRLYDAKLRYISLPADYFPLFMILGIAISGILLRYFTKTDIVAAKQLAIGIVTFSPIVPEGLGVMFFIHLFSVSVLFAYFPISKLMHMGGVFLSPTRNLANNNRMKRHVNPWDYPVKLHTYEEYEDEFRDVMKAADLPLEKDS